MSKTGSKREKKPMIRMRQDNELLSAAIECNIINLKYMVANILSEPLTKLFCHDSITGIITEQFHSTN